MDKPSVQVYGRHCMCVSIYTSIIIMYFITHSHHTHIRRTMMKSCQGKVAGTTSRSKNSGISRFLVRHASKSLGNV